MEATVECAPCETIPEAPAPVLEAYIDALDAYVPGPFDGKVILIWPEDDPLPGGHGADYGWRDVCREVQVFTAPGEHQSSIALDQNLHVVGECVRRALADSDL